MKKQIPVTPMKRGPMRNIHTLMLFVILVLMAGCASTSQLQSNMDTNMTALRNELQVKIEANQKRIDEVESSVETRISRRVSAVAQDLQKLRAEIVVSRGTIADAADKAKLVEGQNEKMRTHLQATLEAQKKALEFQIKSIDKMLQALKTP